jgi:hypothetical protein
VEQKKTQKSRADEGALKSSRRGFVKGSLAAVPIVMTLPSRSAMGMSSGTASTFGSPKPGGHRIR